MSIIHYICYIVNYRNYANFALEQFVITDGHNI